jgi:hypothetical protein
MSQKKVLLINHEGEESFEVENLKHKDVGEEISFRLKN